MTLSANIPHSLVGPPALRRLRRRTPITLVPAPVYDYTPVRPVQLPHPFVGPPALRRTWRRTPYLVQTVTYPVTNDVRFWYTGAASNGAAQSSQSASLGGYRSSTEAERVGTLYQSGIAGLSVDMASRDNMAGPFGVLKADPGTGTLSYRLGGNAAGASVAIANGETKTVKANNAAAWLRVTRNSATNLSGECVIRFHDQFTNVFAMSDAAEAQSAAGGSRYRAVGCVFGVDADNIKFWNGTLATQAVSSSAQLSGAGAGTIGGATDCFIDWPQQGWACVRSGLTVKEVAYYSSRTDSVLTVPALGRGRLNTSATAGAATDTVDAIGPYRLAWETAVPATGGAVQTIANESSAPTGVSWSAGMTAATGVGPGGVMLNGTQGALWLHRELPAGVSGFSRHECRIQYSFTIAGVEQTGTLAGLFRIADDDLERYELHVGVGSLPDLSAAPDETFTSLPHTTTLTLGTSTTNYCVVNYRNKYNLVTQSRSATVFEIDSGGDQALPSPTGPDLIAWRAGAGGTFVLDAVYLRTLDESNPADKWAIYITYNGVDPDPGVDTPTLVDLVDSGSGVAYLTGYTTAAQANGTVGKLLLRVKRTDDGKFSTNTTIYSAVAVVSGAMTTPVGGAFFEDVAEAQ